LISFSSKLLWELKISSTFESRGERYLFPDSAARALVAILLLKIYKSLEDTPE